MHAIEMHHGKHLQCNGVYRMLPTPVIEVLRTTIRLPD